MASPPPRRRGAGVGELPDLDGPTNPRRRHPVVAARPGLVVKQRGTPISGVVIGLVNGVLQVGDRQGFEHRMTLLDGGFEIDGQVVAPMAGRRLGVLLDHLVDGSKESRLAAAPRLVRTSVRS